MYHRIRMLRTKNIFFTRRMIMSSMSSTEKRPNFAMFRKSQFAVLGTKSTHIFGLRVNFHVYLPPIRPGTRLCSVFPPFCCRFCGKFFGFFVFFRCWVSACVVGTCEFLYDMYHYEHSFATEYVRNHLGYGTMTDGMAKPYITQTIVRFAALILCALMNICKHLNAPSAMATIFGYVSPIPASHRNKYKQGDSVWNFADAGIARRQSAVDNCSSLDFAGPATCFAARQPTAAAQMFQFAWVGLWVAAPIDWNRRLHRVVRAAMSHR